VTGLIIFTDNTRLKEKECQERGEEVEFLPDKIELSGNSYKGVPRAAGESEK